MIRKIICFLRKFLFYQCISLSSLNLHSCPLFLSLFPSPHWSSMKAMEEKILTTESCHRSTPFYILVSWLANGQWPLAIPVLLYTKFQLQCSPAPPPPSPPRSSEYIPNSPKVEEIIPPLKIQDRTFRATRDFFLTGGHF